MTRPRPRHSRGRPRGDTGITTVETVLLTPLLAALIVLVAALGLMVNARADINSAARDAARAGSLQRNYGDAVAAARTVAAQTLDDLCASVTVASVGGPGAFTEGGMFTIQIHCQVDTSFAAGLLGGDRTLTARAAAPLDTLRRVN
jgi:Flp pilus assembly protein TadG